MFGAESKATVPKIILAHKNLKIPRSNAEKHCHAVFITLMFYGRENQTENVSVQIKFKKFKNPPA